RCSRSFPAPTPSVEAGRATTVGSMAGHAPWDSLPVLRRPRDSCAAPDSPTGHIRCRAARDPLPSGHGRGRATALALAPLPGLGAGPGQAMALALGPLLGVDAGPGPGRIHRRDGSAGPRLPLL